MRDIKFRAWDKSVKTMCGVGEIHFCHGGIKAFGPGVHLGNGWVTECNEQKNHCDVILMQYTGMSDKNGKDIYEGDIMGGGAFPSQSVSFHNGAFGFHSSSQGHSQINQDRATRLEVIGNIYESPELLED